MNKEKKTDLEKSTKVYLSNEMPEGFSDPVENLNYFKKIELKSSSVDVCCYQYLAEFVEKVVFTILFDVSNLIR